MSDPVPADIEIFDPPLCCPTGLCGPVLDTTLVDLSEAIFALQADGRTVVRHMMTAEPQAFLRNREVYHLHRERQHALPPTPGPRPSRPKAIRPRAGAGKAGPAT